MARTYDEEEDKRLWDTLHDQNNRLIRVEAELNYSKVSTANLICRQDKHEEKFEVTFNKMTDALVSIKEQVSGFMSSHQAAEELKDKLIRVILIIGIPLASAFTFLVKEYIQHM